MFFLSAVLMVLGLSCPTEDADCTWHPCIHGNHVGYDTHGQHWDCR